MKNLKRIIVLAPLLFSCNNKGTDCYTPELEMDDLKKAIIYHNDKHSYGVFLDISANDSLNYESLPISLLLADQGDVKASQMVFYYMVAIFNNNKFRLDNLSKLSEINKTYALYHLKKAAKMNDVQSQAYLEEIYRKGIGIEKNEKKADSLLNVLKTDDPTFEPIY